MKISSAEFMAEMHSLNDANRLSTTETLVMVDILTTIITLPDESIRRIAKRLHDIFELCERASDDDRSCRVKAQ
jgi:hypothetical protein